MSVAEPTARLELLGGVRLTGTDGDVWNLSGHPATIVATLALNNGVVSTERLIDTVWWEVPESGRNALQRHVSRVRRVFECAGAPGAVRTAGRTGYELDRKIVWVDVDQLDHVRGGSGPGRRAEDGPRWWLEPLAGIDCDALIPAKQRLAQQCERAGSQVAERSSPQVPVEVQEALREWLARGAREGARAQSVKDWLALQADAVGRGCFNRFDEQLAATRLD